MSDRNMKRIFREAAEIARAVPPEFRQTAFDKAVDMLQQQQRDQRETDLAETGRATRVNVTGFSAPDAILDKYVEALAFAAKRLGVEAVSADQIAEIMNDRFGMPTPATVVASALTGAGMMVRTARVGGKTLYRLATPAKRPPAYSGPERRHTPGAGSAAGAPEKPSRRAASPASVKPKKRRKTVSDNPADILNDLVTLGFFRTAKTTADVLLYLEKQGLELTTRQIAPILFRLMQAGLLGRNRSGSSYEYYAE